MRLLRYVTWLFVVVFLGWTAGAHAALVYSTNGGDNTVSVIDTATNTEILPRISVGNTPVGVAAIPDGSRVYVANIFSDTVSVIDTSTNTVIATVPVGSAPLPVVAHPDGTRVYVAHVSDHTVSIIDTATNTVIDTVPVAIGPNSMAVTLDGTRVYVTSSERQTGPFFSVIDTANNMVEIFTTLDDSSTGVAVSPDGTRVYFSNVELKVSVVDTTDHSLITTIPVAEGAAGIIVSPDGTRVYVATVPGVSVIDTATNTVIDTVLVAGRPVRLVVTPDGTQVYVANTSGNTIAVIDTATNTVTDTVLVGNTPNDLTITIPPGANISPTAEAGAGQTVHPGTSVTFDGTGSFDPDNNTPLSFAWSITAKPSGSTAILVGSDISMPSFTPDVLGDYTIELVVTDSLGTSSAPDEVVISTFNTTPEADAGLDQEILQLGTTVQLDGTQSFDFDGDPITYLWYFDQKPMGSMASLSDPTLPDPTFVADLQGEYAFSLVVTDNFDAASDPDTVVVSFLNLPPVAEAGDNQAVLAGDTVLLDGSGSSDPNIDSLTFLWSLVATPDGSIATLDDDTAITPSFVADLPGTYIVSLVVNDGLLNSPPSNVTIQTSLIQDVITDKLRALIDVINGLDPGVFKNRNLKKALTNKLNAVIAKIDGGDFQDALNKLENDVLGKTNGCAESGSPDPNDWLTDCVAQNQVYLLLDECINLLRTLI